MSDTPLILLSNGKPATVAQTRLILKLVENNLDSIDPIWYYNMAVPQIVEAMDEASKRLEQLKKTELGRQLV